MGARPKCADVQGRIFDRANKSKKYPHWSTTSYGQPDGILGINCRHQIYPFIDGVNVQTYFPQDEEENDKAYKLSQQQRQLERDVRSSKRKCMALDTLQDKDKSDFQKASVRLKQKEAKLRNFCKANDLPCRSDRTAVVGYNRSISAKAVSANKKALRNRVETINLDFMGKAQIMKTEKFEIKAYQVDGYENIFSQTYTNDARNTIAFVNKMKNDGIINDISKTVVVKDLPGLAAYSHTDNTLYVNEKISNSDFIKKKLSQGYFVAENAEDIIKHEMFHKKHWDYILTKGGNSDIMKQSIEADLHKYVAQQQSQEFNYIRNVASDNAYDKYNRPKPADNPNVLNELIAEVLLRNEKGTCKDKILLKLVRGCIE